MRLVGAGLSAKKDQKAGMCRKATVSCISTLTCAVNNVEWLKTLMRFVRTAYVVRV